ncbi:putative RNA-directed DNA polymerase [Helianthus annuus]|nr:putative RNA-directed DNA polymerase [Helianthus annuus]
MINEVLAWLKKERKVFLLKIDFEKVYNNVSWEFLIDSMVRMGFPPLCCKWIKGIIGAARSTILVNGAPTFEFNCTKGIRQGDSLSPFLFLIFMEDLSCSRGFMYYQRHSDTTQQPSSLSSLVRRRCSHPRRMVK